MAIDSTPQIRVALVALMKADTALIALVPKASIYSQWTPAVPAFPFIRSGSPAAAPMRGSCLDGSDITVAMHAFSTGRKSGTTIVEPAEDHAARIGAAIAAALDGKVVTIAGGKARVRWTGSQLMQDPEESSAFHSVQSFRIRAITA